MTFDESEESNKPDEPKDPNQKVHDTDVKGTYYPGDSVGGALTGDNTSLMMYIGFCFTTLGIILFLVYKKQEFINKS